jgi:predicted RNA-binding protein
MHTIQDVELKLKEIDMDFTVEANPSNELASVYWKGVCAYISMPKAGVKDAPDYNYVDSFGRTHRCLTEVLERTKQFMLDVTTNEAYRKDILQTEAEFTAEMAKIDKDNKQAEIEASAQNAVPTEAIDVTPVTEPTPEPVVEPVAPVVA